MISKLQIGALRGLRNLSLDGLGRVNLLLGSNNSGKSSVLEALLLWAEPSTLGVWMQLARMRTSWPLAGGSSAPVRQHLEWLFPHLERRTEPVEVTASGLRERSVIAEFDTIFGPVRSPVAKTWLQREGVRDVGGVPAKQHGCLVRTITSDDGGDSASELCFWDDNSTAFDGQSAPTVRCVVVNAFSHRSAEVLEVQWTEAVKSDLHAAVISLVHAFDPAIEAIQILNEGEGGARGLFVRHKSRGFLPLDAFGDGVRRAIHFALAVIAARGGLLLIDEIEIAIHTSVIADVFDWLVDACIEHDVQLFATTHSLEAVDAIIGGRAGSSDDVVAWRLADGRLEKRIRGDLLRRLRFDRGLEVRG